MSSEDDDCVTARRTCSRTPISQSCIWELKVQPLQQSETQQAKQTVEN